MRKFGAIGPLGSLIVLIVLLSILSPYFLTVNNLFNVFQQITVLAIIALGASLVVGWMLPLGVLAVGIGIAARRRPSPGRAMAIWAIALGAGSILYSAAWLTWAVVASGALG